MKLQRAIAKFNFSLSLVPGLGTLCYVVRMLKGEDIVLLLKLSGSDPNWTVRALEHETTIPRSVVQRALKRLSDAGLFDRRRQTPNISQAEEFLLHGVRYVFPAVIEGESRGVPTAWAAPPLVDVIANPDNGLPPVWSDARGQVRGLALRPLHSSVVEASGRDPALAELLALVDAIRLGDARIRNVASDLLADRLRQPVA
jgi:hypothetical protein